MRAKAHGQGLLLEKAIGRNLKKCVEHVATTSQRDPLRIVHPIFLVHDLTCLLHKSGKWGEVGQECGASSAIAALQKVAKRTE
eukprot:6185471-Amphidinium_carterae.1